MGYGTHFLFVLFVLPGIFSEAFPRVSDITREGPQEQHLCDQYCHGYQRECERPPYTCGGCRGNFLEHDGVCLQPHLVDDDIRQKLELDSNIDEIAEKRAHLDDNPADLAVADETNDVVDSEVVKAHGEGATIPDNAQINRILHAPGHSQDRKVQDVYKAAEAMEAAAASHDGDAHAVLTKTDANMADVYFLAVIAGCSIAGLIGLVVAGVCWYRLQKNVKAASETEYPAYGVTGPVPEKVASPGDRKLAQSAQMYHYQHQKQQMIAMEKANGDMTKDGSDADSEEENEEGDYTVYECPGLAPTGEMEVKNPLFSEETPVTPSEPAPK